MMSIVSHRFAMFQKRLAHAVFATALAVVLLCTSAPITDAGVPQAMMTGLQQLNERNYRAALSSFQAAAKVSPSDPQVRYCLAIAYHYLGFLQEAEKEYTWVVKSSPDPALQRRAAKGIASCRDAEMPMGGGAGGMLSRAEALEQFGRAAAAKPPMFTKGMPSVVNFWVGWCGWSTRFKHMLVNANARYGNKIKFVLVDAEAKPELRDQWGVDSYPTTFLFDGNGNMLTVFSGCPHDFADFEQELKQYFPQVDPNYKPPPVVPSSKAVITSWLPK
jgi:thiol-disulfide isomerase/thioredoxin